MDPDEALRMIRRLLDEITEDLDAAHSADVEEIDAANVSQLVDVARGLDEWLSHGGFLPVAWAHPFGSAQDRNRDRSGGAS